MARTWTCSRCDVTATFEAGGSEQRSPTGWAEHGGEWRCLGCRRAEVAESAFDGSQDGRSARRRLALTEFELLRDPSASDQLIAKRVRCPTASVRPVRRALHDAGRLRPGAEGAARRG